MSSVNVLTAVSASIPSPAQGEWNLGPVPIRAYALAILIGILVAIWVGNKRWLARGGQPEVVVDIAIWAVPFGVVGARVYHVVTDWDKYFGDGRDPVDAIRIWEGGLSIWGAIAFGVLGGWIAAKRRGIPMPALADALAPGIVLAQAIGRWGNYFNQELFGRPTDLPWGLEIDLAHRPQGFAEVETFHPTFLYESLWALAIFGILIWADRRFQMGHGRVFALYVALYTAGRVGIEELRIDTGGDVLGPAREILGLRINALVSVALFVGAVLYIVISARLRPGREAPETLVGKVAADAETSSSSDEEGSSSSGEDADSDEDARADAGADADADADAESEDSSKDESAASEDTETAVPKES
jgi:prolipoprotein diacylglyceryl transferase